MALHDTTRSYGQISRMLHWLIAALIISLFTLGFIANRIAPDSPDAVAAKITLFSAHKTLGVAVFALALARLMWRLFSPRPAPLHPERRLETLAAETTHVGLHLGLVVVPLSGWVHHAALDGYAPIWWPFGQGLPMVPKSDSLAHLAGGLHALFIWVLLAAIILHVAGALKHALIDRDATLGRMTRGLAAGPDKGAASGHVAPIAAALAGWATITLGALWLADQPVAPQTSIPRTVTPSTAEAPAVETPAATHGWQVESGSLKIRVNQMGSAVEGSFQTWSARIIHDESAALPGPSGEVDVRVDIASLQLGSVSAQATSADFLDAGAHPEARFTARLERDANSAHVARGTLELRGATVPLELPFTLMIEGDTARMQGTTRLDRRDFGIGTAYGDETTVGFGVEIEVELSASRAH